MSQKLQLKSDLTLDAVIQKARQSEMVKTQVADQNSLGSKDLEEMRSKQKTVNSRSRKGEEAKEDSSRKQCQKKCGRCGRYHTKPEHLFSERYEVLEMPNGWSLCSCMLV